MGSSVRETDQRVDSAEVQKILRLVDYLTRIASLRTKLTRDISEFEKTLWISDVPHERGCFTQAWGRDEEHDAEEWLEVQNRREPELPAVPSQCKDWVNPSRILTKSELPGLLSEITRHVQNPDWHQGSDQSRTIACTERLENNPDVQRRWESYLQDKWLPWVEEHNAWEKVYKVYSALFAIHQAQLRLGEEYELVIGLGLLTWQTRTGHRVQRHLVVADAILEFEPRLGKFTLRPHTEGAKLRPELDMLDIEEQPARAEDTAKSSLTNAEDDPWEKACVEGVLQALVHSINSQGRYDDCLERKGIRASTTPIIEYAPALVLRMRSAKGLTETLKRIKERIENGERIPSEFADLAETQSNDDFETRDGIQEVNATFDGEVFFPKPSNEEQRRIVEKIRTASGVLVQGPPGTGKSHTIANLICHLLATGKRILVTAKTPRALEVLLGKANRGTNSDNRHARPGNWREEGLIPDEIKPLCICLLGAGLEDRRSLESSVAAILRKNDEWNEDRATRERAELEKLLRNLREEGAQVNRRLRDIRESETHAQLIGDGSYRGTAARIAEAVNRNRSAYGWLADSIRPDKACPVSANVLRTMLGALRYFTPQKRSELSLELPESVPSAEDFVSLVQSETSAIEQEQLAAGGTSGHMADLMRNSSYESIERCHRALSDFQSHYKSLLGSTHPWMGEALRDVLGSNSSLWRELSRVTTHTINSIEALVASADDTTIDFAETTNTRTLYEDACKLKEHLEHGGKLGWGPFRAKEVRERLYVIKTVRVAGQICSTLKHLSVLASVLQVRIECEKAWGFWVGRAHRTQGPYVLQMTALKALCSAPENALLLEDLIEKCRQAMRMCPTLREPVWADELQVEGRIAACRLALARIRRRLAAD
jgi:hypothetical protein